LKFRYYPVSKIAFLCSTFNLSKFNNCQFFFKWLWFPKLLCHYLNLPVFLLLSF